MSTLKDILSNDFRQCDDIAVVAPDGNLAYRELGDEANAIAHLVAGKCGKGSVVALILPRSKHFIPAALGVMKAGCIYMPVDMQTPAQRVSSIMDWSGTAVAITVREFVEDNAGLIPEDRTILIDEVDFDSADQADIDLSEDNKPALIICTSGTTGVPKGILHSLDSLSFLSSPELVTPVLERSSHISSAVLADFSFLASAVDMFYPLSMCGTVHIVDSDTVHDVERLGKYLCDNDISHVSVSAGVACLLAGSGNCPSGIIAFTGERPSAISDIQAKRALFVNSYGSSECGRCARYHVAGDEPLIPIGKPYDDVDIFLLDDDFNIVPTGAVGEMFVSSPGIAMCYFNDDDLTAQRFLDCPFRPGRKMFRTGDMARLDQDGNLVFCGRRDNLLKIRGFRIETGEVENAALSYAGVGAACLRPVEERSTVLYYTGDVFAADLERHLENLLPRYMIPGRLVKLENMPRNQHGKIDTSALGGMSARIDRAPYEEPATESETAVADAMSKVLGIERVGVNDDFFLLGGDSLSAMALVMELKDSCINAAIIHRERTPRQIASSVGTCLTRCDESKDNILALNASQRAILDCQALKPYSRMWNNPLLYRLDDDVDIDRLVQSITQVVAAHPLLSSRLDCTDSRHPVFVHDASLPVNVEIVDADNIVDCQTTLVTHFSLKSGYPFYCARIIKCLSANYLFLDFHHVICDGTSIGLFVKDVMRAYYGESLPQDLYARYVGNSEPCVDTDQYVLEKYGDADWMRVPVPDFAEPKYELGSRLIKLPLDGGRVLRSSHSLNIMLVTAAAEALAEQYGRHDVIVNWVYDNRGDALSRDCFGTLIKSPRVCLRMDRFSTRGELIAEVERQVSDGIASNVEWAPEFAALEVNNLATFTFPSSKGMSLLKRMEVPRILCNDAPSEQFDIELYRSGNDYSILANYDASMYSDDTVDSFISIFVEKFVSLF